MAEILELPRAEATRGRRVPFTVAVALALLIVLVVFAVFGSVIAPHDPDEQRLLVSDTPPSSEFWAGTDQLGRDVLSRSIVGARTALVGAVVVSVGAFAIATVLGLISGYLGGATDAVVHDNEDRRIAFVAQRACVWDRIVVLRDAVGGRPDDGGGLAAKNIARTR